MMIAINQRIRRGKRDTAFTLIEMSIVLFVAATLLAAVWAAGSMVWDNYQMWRLNNQIMKVVQNIRDFYGSRGLHGTAGAGGTPTYLPGINGANITAIVDGAGLIPLEMRDSSCPAPPAGCGVISHAVRTLATGSLRLRAQNATGDTLRFQIGGMSTKQCAKLLMNFPLLTPEVKIRRFCTYCGLGSDCGSGFDSGALNISSFAQPFPNISLPFNLTTALNWCNNCAIGADNNVVDFRFFMDQ